MNCSENNKSKTKQNKSKPKKSKGVNVTLVNPMHQNTVQVSINQAKTSALVDTGASISCIAKTFLEKSGFQNQTLDPSNVAKVVGVCGETHKVLGTIQLPINFGNQIIWQNFHVFQKLHHSMILGLDFMEKHKANIDMGNKVLYIQNNSAQAGSYQTDVGLARTATPIRIPPQQEITIPVKISKHKHGQVLLLEPLPGIANDNIAGAKCLVKVIKGKSQFRLLNPTDQEIFLPQGRPIATAAPIETDSIQPLEPTDSSTDQSPSINSANPQVNTEPIEVNLEHSDLSPEQKTQLTEFLQNNRDVFATNLKQLGKTDLYQHRIDTEPCNPIRQRFYRATPTVRAEMTKQIDEMLDAGIIEESSSCWQSPVVMVKKKDGSFRLAIDYRVLNKYTKITTFPLPRLDDVFDSIGESKAQVFSKLDLLGAYWQLPMDPETAFKSGFVTNEGSYVFRRLPFGLVNAGSSFQMLMSKVLKGLNWKIVLAYIDDILVMSKNFEEHIQHLKLVFDRLREAGLTLKPSKCEFGVKEVTFLGHVISKQGIQCDKNKTEAVNSFPVPKNVHDIRSFVGLCQFYRRYIKSFSQIAAPLTQLLRNDVPFVWGDAQQKAFDTLKTSLTTSPILAYPDMQKDYVLTTDASIQAISYILSQLDNEGRERVISYGGRSLKAGEKNWPISELECLAVLEGIKHYHIYLANKKFKVYTDHRALVYLQNIKQGTGRLARWSVLLQGYSFDIEHRRGIHNKNADALSRRDYPPQSITNDRDIEDMLPSTTQVSSTHAQVRESPEGNEVYEVQFFYDSPDTVSSKPPLIAVTEPEKRADIGQLQRDCNDFQAIITYLETGELPEVAKLARTVVHESSQYQMLNSVLFHFYQPRTRGLPAEQRLIKQLALPKILREDCLLAYHDSKAAGCHLGIERTFIAIRNKYHWKHQYQDIHDYITSCDVCQRAKRHYHAHPAPLASMPVEEAFSRLHIDIMGPLTKTKEGYKYLLVIVDSFTKWTESFPIRTQEATEVADILYKEIFTRFGPPDRIVSDRGQTFVSKLVNAICQIFQVTRHVISSYHPCANSCVERMNQPIAQCLRTYCDEKQSNWADVIPSIMYALRMSPCSQTTGYSPYYLVFGREMRTPFDQALIPKDTLPQTVKQHVQKVLDNLEIARKIATENVLRVQEKSKERFDKNTKPPPFALGDVVLLYTPRVPVGLSKKLHNKWTGPFYIDKVTPHYTFYLRWSKDDKPLKASVHANRLKLYMDPRHRHHGQPIVRQPDPVTAAPPDIVTEQGPTRPITGDPQAHRQCTPKVASDTDQHNPPVGNKSQSDNQSQSEFHQVDRLLKTAVIRGKRHYQVRWLNVAKTSWEPLDHIPESLRQEFHVHKTNDGRSRKRPARQPSYFKPVKR
jgi:transposase InsO family protein